MDFMEQMIRTLLFGLDNIVYSLIANAYELIVYLANINLISENSALSELIGRVYLLLGIFMLFKVSFSMIQYLIDPNSFSDSSKGFGKLVRNTLLAIILLVSVPFIFTELYKFQEYVIESEVINKLILGKDFGSTVDEGSEETDEGIKNTKIRQMAVDVQFAMFSAFYTLNTKDDRVGITACRPTDDNPSSNVIGSLDMASNANCLEAFARDSEPEMSKRNITMEDFFKTASGDKISDKRNFGAFGKLLYWKKAGTGTDFTINYTPIISTLAGGYLLLLLITFAIDIALRAIKLMFLQAIAPIAIVSYIDPKESSTSSKLYKWATEVAKTYFSLFLRLAVIFLALRLIQMITSMMFYPIEGENQLTYYNNVAPQGMMNMFVYVFLILGIFAFAKKVPQMIENIFGIKMSGEMKLNPLKSLNENPALSFLGGGLFGTAGGLAAGYRGAKETGVDLKKALAAGALSGAKFGVQNRGKNGVLGNAMNNAYKDVTGNEMKRLNLARSIMGVGANKRIDALNEVKAKNTSDKLTLQRELKRLEDSRKSAYSNVSKYKPIMDAKKNYDSALDKVKKAEQNKNANMKTLNQKFRASTNEELQRKLSTVSGKEYDEISSELSARKNNEDIKQSLARAYAEKNSAEQQLNSFDIGYDEAKIRYDQAVSNYNEVLEAEDRLTRAIGDIDKDTEVIKGQIKEEKQTAGLDLTPKERVEGAISNSGARKVDDIINGGGA